MFSMQSTICMDTRSRDKTEEYAADSRSNIANDCCSDPFCTARVRAARRGDPSPIPAVAILEKLWCRTTSYLPSTENASSTLPGIPPNWL
jgi:hypothetical protein